MDYVEVKALLDAGFTADEIRGMMGNVQANNPQFPQINPQGMEPDPAEQNTQDPDGDHSQHDAPDPSAPVSVPGEQTNPEFTQLNATMEKLIRTIQQSNLRNQSFDSPNGGISLDDQVDKIMGSIIRPERKEGGNL